MGDCMEAGSPVAVCAVEQRVTRVWRGIADLMRERFVILSARQAHAAGIEYQSPFSEGHHALDMGMTALDEAGDDFCPCSGTQAPDRDSFKEIGRAAGGGAMNEQDIAFQPKRCRKPRHPVEMMRGEGPQVKRSASPIS